MPKRYVRLQSGRLVEEGKFNARIDRINREGPHFELARFRDEEFLQDAGFKSQSELESEKYLRDTLNKSRTREDAFEKVFADLTDEELGFDSTSGALTVKKGRSNFAERLEKLFTGEDAREELERVAYLSTSVKANKARKDLNRRLKKTAGYVGFRLEDSQKEIVKKQEELEINLEKQEQEAISNYRSTLIQQLVDAGGTEDIKSQSPDRRQTPPDSVTARLARL